MKKNGNKPTGYIIGLTMHSYATFFHRKPLPLPQKTGKTTNMAENLLGKYVWLMDVLLRYKRLTFQEINNLWQRSELGSGDELPLRTFHNHRKAIKDIFDVYIECNRNDGYHYYIDEPERIKNNHLRNWLISSYATLNQIQADNKLENRILFENIPSGQTWLTTLAEAMRYNKVLNITHQGFGKPEAHTFEIEPYALKVVKRRWYVVARNPYYSEKNKEKKIKPGDVYLVYALDRISDIQDTGKTFKMKKDFDIDQFFEGCCGVITSDEPVQRIVIAAYEGFADYLRTLPLHESQQEIGGDENARLFEYYLKPTLDFYLSVLAHGDQIEVLEPEPVRKKCAAKSISSCLSIRKRPEIQTKDKTARSPARHPTCRPITPEQTADEKLSAYVKTKHPQHHCRWKQAAQPADENSSEL